MNNKRLGTDFERAVCRYMKDQGYWVHFITPSAAGSQPFDIIAVRSGIGVAVECKTLRDDAFRFDLSRLELNQSLAFAKWKKAGNVIAYVAVGWRKHMYFVNYWELERNGNVDMRLQKPVAFDNGEAVYE